MSANARIIVCDDDDLVRAFQHAHASRLDEHPVHRSQLARERGPRGGAQERRLPVHGAARTDDHVGGRVAQFVRPLLTVHAAGLV